MKTSSERKQAERWRKRASGLVRKEIWCRPEHWEQIKRFASRLSENYNQENSENERACDVIK